MVPAVADHVTVWLVVLLTVTLNCRDLLTRRDALVGEIVTLMGGGGGGPVIVTCAVPTAEDRAALVACTVTVAGFGTALGAVYSPLTESINPTAEFPPTLPFTPHVTLWSLEPFTTAPNCCFTLTATLALGGVTVTEIPFCRAWPEFGSTISGETSTTSKAEPVMVVRTCRSVLSQRESGAPETNHAEPLSAIIIPYF